jgi:hypothetical protein
MVVETGMRAEVSCCKYGKIMMIVDIEDGFKG